MTDEFSAASPSACPFCEAMGIDFEGITHDGTDDGDLEFTWECPECENTFKTIKALESDGPEVWSLLWLEDLESNVFRVVQVEGDDDAPGVKIQRAKHNMLQGDAYEVQGNKWSIDRLFDIFGEVYDLPVAEDVGEDSFESLFMRNEDDC